MPPTLASESAEKTELCIEPIEHWKAYRASMKESNSRVSLANDTMITSLAAHLGDGLLTINQSGRISFVNESATAITGYAKDEMMEQAVEQLFPPAVERNEEFHPITRALKTKETVAYQSKPRLKEINLIVIPTDLSKGGSRMNRASAISLLTTSAIVLFSATAVSQTRGSTSEMKVEAVVFPHADEMVAGEGFMVLADRRIFAVMAFLNAAGYEDEAQGQPMHPVRIKVRQLVAANLAKSPEKLQAWRKYYQRKKFRNYHFQDWALSLSADYPFRRIRPNNELQYILTALMQFKLPSSWQIVTPMRATSGGGYAADNYRQLLDSPIQFGRLQERTVSVGNVRCRLVFDAQLPAYDEHAFDENIRKIIAYEMKLMGSAPFQEYTVLFHWRPDLDYGGGIEHGRAMIMNVGKRWMLDLPTNVSGTFAHELFHTWNAGAVHPRDLDKWDYTRENYTRLMWFIEGVTNY